LKHARLAAFGSTRRSGTRADEDPQLRTLLDSGMPVMTLVGKTWTLHVTEILRTTLEENLAMIEDSVRYLVAQGREVIYDAEHFFDGYRADPDYALRTQRVVGIGAVPVEKVFGVVDDLASLRDEVANGILDHREVLLERRAEDFRDVQGPGLPDERHHGHAAVEQGPELRILIGPGAGAAGRAEGGEAGVLEAQPAGRGEGREGPG